VSAPLETELDLLLAIYYAAKNLLNEDPPERGDGRMLLHHLALRVSLYDDAQPLSQAQGEEAMKIECPACGAPAGYPCNAPTEGVAAREVCPHRAYAAEVF
jgi:hypothetical protein